MAQSKSVAIVGATGAVGKEILSILEERDFPVKNLRLLASERSAGKTLVFKDETLEVEELTDESFAGIDIALFSAGGAVSQEFCPVAIAEGTICVDNTSAFRMDKEVPLVVPEVNPEEIKNHKGLIANPNCSTIQMVGVLKPIHDALGLKRVIVSTYQSVSGVGTQGILELEDQVKDISKGRPVTSKNFTSQIAFNAIPHIDSFIENGFTKEEMKMINETRKILNHPDLAITATTVRVPVIRAHSESVNVETEKDIDVSDLKDLLADTPGVSLIDDPSSNKYPLAVNASGKDDIFVGRIRRDESVERGFHLWIVSDNLRKGAALNAVQIAELLV
ncbi:aspartate-semialdehyde dehydrogenase [PVC group bacterium (ex Bugula neritina AB1)]|nr:aspartate-semialdehyde dehydrogenase [PVC group bacterium (ex Bugula neritina AB1)]